MSNNFKNIDRKTILPPLLVIAFFLLWHWLIIGIRSDHFYLLGISLLLYFAHPTSRKLFWMFLPFLIYLMVYDSLRIFPNYEFNKIHIEETYQLEKKYFGIKEEQLTLTPNEYLTQNQSSLWDVLSGLFYLSWIPIPIVFGLYLFMIKKREEGLDLWNAFFVVNIIGFLIYYLYPAAPPWYVDQYGFKLNIDTMGSAAGLSRFDTFFDIQLFHGIYSNNAAVFAAIPSMHAAYPLILVYFGWKYKMKFLTLIFMIQTLGIWYSAVYSMHHYIIDILAGIFCTITGVLIFEWFNKKTKIRKLKGKYLINIY